MMVAARARMLRWLTLVATLSLACSSTPGTGGTVGTLPSDGRDDPSMKSCDPLAGTPAPIALMGFVAAGKHAALPLDPEPTTKRPRATVDALTLKSLPGNAIVESAWTLTGDKRFYVVRPEHDWTYTDFRVFFGVATRMVERPVLDVSRGSATYLRFMLEGREVQAYLGSTLASDPSSRLTIDGTAYGLMPAPPSTAGLAFFCR